MRKFKWCLVFIMFFLLFSFNVHPADAGKSQSLNLTKSLITNYSDEDDVYFDSWGSQPFQNTSKEVTKGIGFESSYYSKSPNRMWADFNISDYSFTTLETKVSIENSWKVGDRGETQFLIYADNKKLYSKKFKNTTPAEKLKLAIPKGTKSLKLMVLMDKGTQGNHGAIFGNPVLTKSLASSPNFNSLSLQDLGPAYQSDEDDVYEGDWSYEAFKLSNGQMEGIGYGFEPSYYSSSPNRMYATFNIEDYDYTTFETTISLDDAWRLGDKGKTQAIIYADSKKIYSKTFSNTTKLENVKLSIPSGTKYLELMVVMEKGSQGNHGIIFSNPLLTYELANSSSVNSVLLSSIGIAGQSDSDDVYYGDWNDLAFQSSDGTLEGVGYGFKRSYYSNSPENMWADYYIADYEFSKLLTTISIDNKWKKGDMGLSTVYISADEKIIYEKVFTNTTPLQKVALNIPKGTTYLKLQVKQQQGVNGTHGVIFAEPLLTIKDVTAPTKATFSAITNKSTIITGKAEIGSNVSVWSKGKMLKEVKTDVAGKFIIPISKKHTAGTIVDIVVKDNAGNNSKVSYKVKDAIAPSRPVLTGNITNNLTIVKGKAEPSSIVVIKSGSTIIGKGAVSSAGVFSITIKKQKEYLKLSITATDEAGNVSVPLQVIVADVIPPSTLSVNKVTPKTTYVTGKTEALVNISIKVNSKLIGSGAADKYGNYKIKIPLQKKGTKVYVYASDKAENTKSSDVIVN